MTSLAFTTYLLAAHPEVQEKVFAEMEAVIGPTNDDEEVLTKVECSGKRLTVCWKI
jgi:cytochrome P450